MKINILDAHDRKEHFTKQGFDIAECVQDIIDKSPFGNVPFYIFAHARTEDDGLNKRMIWQPRLTRPKSQTNSMLFKVTPNSDNVKVIWIIPDRVLWDQYTKGKLLENQTIIESIHDFQFNRNKLDTPDDDDLPDSKIDAIYKQMSKPKT